MLVRNKNIILFYLLCLLNIFGLFYFLINKKNLFFTYSLLPAAILIVFLALFKMDTLIKGVVFFTPLSVSLKDLGIIDDSFDLSIPTEPILAGIMLIFLFNEIHNGFTDKKIWRHPVTIIILLQIFWTTITTVTSSMPLVSFKFLVAKIWFITTAYFLMNSLFRERKNLFQFTWLYIIPFAGVIMYTIVNHNQQGFTEDAADWVVKPFYNDHTSYGAMLALFIPFLVGFIFLKGIQSHLRLLIFFVFCLFILGLILSFTRAAWISIFAALAIGLTMFFRIRFGVLLSLFVALLGVFFLFQSEITIAL